MVPRTVSRQKTQVEARMRKSQSAVTVGVVKIAGVVEVKDNDENKTCIEMKAYVWNNWQINKLVFHPVNFIFLKKDAQRPFSIFPKMHTDCGINVSLI